MAREKRQLSPTGVYHILLRGIDELFSKKSDFEEFISILNSYFADTDAKLLGYALMKNRVHMIIDEGNVGISAVIKPICTRYARYYNRVYDLQGKLFYDRYKSEPIGDNKELAEVKSFLSSIPSEFLGGVAGAKKAESLTCIDDYYRMTDAELKSYIESVFDCKIEKLSKDKKLALAETIIAGKRISAGRIYSIFELKKKTAPKKDSAPKTTKPEVREEPEKKSGGLSFWLL